MTTYSGKNVLALAAEIAETAYQMASTQGISPKDARLALELASRVFIGNKESSETLAKKVSDEILNLQAVMIRNPDIGVHLEKLIIAADRFLEEK
ncbi:hypothetical protein ACB496_12930 [Lelliottia nimipressuralis]|uniref:hypothetical protein n=1 Tax=Lelliottia nimipressuralis TaxID=69220 RepID=UPI003557448C